MVWCIALPVSTRAQQFTLQGVAFRKNAMQRLAKVLVADLKNDALVATDDLGIFHINCAVGDTLLFRQKDYLDQKLVGLNQNDLMVYMIPTINLKQVDITGQTTKQELNEVVNAYRSKGLYFDGRPPISTFSPFGGSPVTGFKELFSRDAKNERHFIKFAAKETEQTDIDRRFTPKLIKQATGISSDDLQPFMAAYRPLYKDLKIWNDYDLTSYIKKSYQAFILGNDRKPVFQKLVQDTVQ